MLAKQSGTPKFSKESFLKSFENQRAAQPEDLMEASKKPIVEEVDHTLNIGNLRVLEDAIRDMD